MGLKNIYNTRSVTTYAYVDPFVPSQLIHARSLGHRRGPEGRLHRVVAEGRHLPEVLWSSVYTTKSSIFLKTGQT
jgi:hypothetical protein